MFAETFSFSLTSVYYTICLLPSILVIFVYRTTRVASNLYQYVYAQACYEVEIYAPGLQVRSHICLLFKLS